jgi:hypothetical protein
VKNPVCRCDKPAVVRCAGCGRYFCAECNEEHQLEIVEEIEAADRLTGKGRYSTRYHWARRARGEESNETIII